MSQGGYKSREHAVSGRAWMSPSFDPYGTKSHPLPGQSRRVFCSRQRAGDGSGEFLQNKHRPDGGPPPSLRYPHSPHNVSAIAVTKILDTSALEKG